MLKPLPLDDHLLAEINALNRQFIRVLLGAQSAGRAAVEADLVRRLHARCGEHDAAWPSCPFLLFRIVAAGDAIADSPRLVETDAPMADLITLSLGFVWQLARERLQVAQIVSGADRAWCERLAAMPISHLAGLSLQASLQPRLIDVPGFWQDLSRSRGISALQRASLGAAGLQLILSGKRRARVLRHSVLAVTGPRA